MEKTHDHEFFSLSVNTSFLGMVGVFFYFGATTKFVKLQPEQNVQKLKH